MDYCFKSMAKYVDFSVFLCLVNFCVHVCVCVCVGLCVCVCVFFVAVFSWWLGCVFVVVWWCFCGGVVVFL